MSLLFAATHPERCRALCVVGGFAKLLRSDDYELGHPPEAFDDVFGALPERWGEPALIDVLAPSIANDEQERARWGRFERLGSNPSAMRAAGRMFREIDLRPVLAQIGVPTLVVHAAGDLAIPRGVGVYLAEHIPGAKYVEYEARDHAFWIHPEPIGDAIQEFLTGAPAAASEASRVLATVAFVDVARASAAASSTRRATACSRRSTDPHARCATRSRCATARGRSASSSEPACTPGSASGSATSSRGSRCTSGRGSHRWPSRARSSSPVRFATSSRARVSRSATAAASRCVVCRASGGCSRWSREPVSVGRLGASRCSPSRR